MLKNRTNKLRIYFNNHYGGKAVINALQFKEMNGVSLNDKEKISYKKHKIIIILTHSSSKFFNFVKIDFTFYKVVKAIL